MEEDVVTISTYIELVLQRDPAPGEAEAWASLVDGGSLTIDEVQTAIIDSAEAVSDVYPIILAYQAIYGRVPDAEGLDYWVNVYRANQSLDDAATPTINEAMVEVLEAFVNPDQTPEFATRYGENPSAAQFVTASYSNVLDRLPDQDGLDFWTNRYDEVRAELVAANPGASQDEINVQVRAIILEQFVSSAEYEESTEVSVDLYLEAVAQGEPGAYDGSLWDLDSSPDQIFTLTDSVDTIPGLIGSEGTADTSGNDLIVGLRSLGDNTFTVGDDIDGGAGNDTLRITTTNVLANEVDLSVADIKNVEHVELRINDENLDTVDFGDDDGEFQTAVLDFRDGQQNADIEIDGLSANAAVTISNIETNGGGIDVDVALEELASDINGSMTLSNVDDLDVWIEVDDSADGSGEADVYSVTFDNVQNSNGNAYWYISDVETLNVTVASDSELEGIGNYYNNDGSDGPNPNVVNLQLDGDLTAGFWDFSDNAGIASTLTITGSGDLTIEVLDDGDSDMTVDASAATGNIDIANASSSLGLLDATFGSGNDRLTLEDGFDMTTLTADGGAGIDTFGVDADNVANIAVANISGFETLELTGAAGVAVSVDADDNDFDNVILGVDVVNNLVVEDLSGDLTIEADQSGTVTITPEGASDDLAVTLDLPGDRIDLFALDVSDYTSVDFTSVTDDGDTSVAFTTLTVDGVGTLSFTGEGDVDIDVLGSADLGLLDLSGLTGYFDNSGAGIDAEADVLVGNLDSGSVIALFDPNLGVNDGTNVLTFGAELDNTISFEGFEGGVGGDVLDLAALGIDAFGDLTITDNGADTSITSADYDGEIVLLGVLAADLDGTANFQFA